MSCMFAACKSLKEVDFSGLDTSNVVSMTGMFAIAGDTYIDAGLDFDGIKAGNYDSFFSGDIVLENLTSLDVSNFNTSKVESMNAMFCGCVSLTELDLSTFDTKNVEDIYGMFTSCKSLTKLNLANFNTSKVQDMGGMFENCSSLVKLDLSNFETTNVQYMDYMFSNCSSLEELDISNFTINANTTVDGFVENCTSLKRIKTPTQVGATIALPTVEDSNLHYATTTNPTDALTEIGSTAQGKVIELFDQTNTSLAPAEEPNVPSTGVTANVLGGVIVLVVIGMIAYVCTSKKRKVLAK